jgi:selenocysteine lyase/cysteine desulfurase
MALRLVEALRSMNGATIYGITDPERIGERCPTVAFRLADVSPLEIATRLGERGIFVWNGNYYAVAVTERLGVEDDGGMVRVGIVHYNTPAEIERLIEEIGAIG